MTPVRGVIGAGKQAVISPLRSGECSVQVSNGQALYPLSVLVRVVEQVGVKKEGGVMATLTDFSVLVHKSLQQPDLILGIPRKYSCLSRAPPSCLPRCYTFVCPDLGSG